MPRQCIITLSFVFLVLSGMNLGYSQNITVNWATQKIEERPSEIHKGQTVTVVAKKVNDILYDYEVGVQLQVQNNSDDYDMFLKLFSAYGQNLPLAQTKLQGLMRTPSNKLTKEQLCAKNIESGKTLLGQIDQELHKEGNALTVTDAQTRPFTLEETLAGWNRAILPLLNQLKEPMAYLSNAANGCTDAQPVLNDYARLQQLQKKVEGPHVAQGQSVASSAEVEAVQITITESWKGKSLHTYNETLTFSSVVSFSGGVLFSTLPDRSYVPISLPLDDSSQTVLGVQNDRRPVPMLLGLLNFRIPWTDPSCFKDRLSFDFSTGPTLRIGGNTTATSFGYFAGISLSFWHRLFITPGIHVGQFSDYPPGFVPLQKIPANFGELKPINRWTAHFALGISYRTIELGPHKIQSETTNAKPESNKPGSNQKPSGTPDPKT